MMPHINKEAYFTERITIQEVVTIKKDWHYEK